MVLRVCDGVKGPPSTNHNTSPYRYLYPFTRFGLSNIRLRISLPSLFLSVTYSCLLQPQSVVYLLMVLGSGTSASEHWPTRPLAPSRLRTQFPRLFSVCRTANDLQFIPGICLGFHERSDSGDGFCPGDMAPAWNVMQGCRDPNPIQKLNRPILHARCSDGGTVRGTDRYVSHTHERGFAVTLMLD